MISAALNALREEGTKEDCIKFIEGLLTEIEASKNSTERKHEDIPLFCELVTNYLARECNAISESKGFKPSSFAESIALMHSELSEALEYDRNAKGGKPIMSEKIPDYTGKEEEFADVLIRVFHRAGLDRMRLGGALIAKMQYNRNRPFKHGKNY